MSIFVLRTLKFAKSINKNVRVWISALTEEEILGLESISVWMAISFPAQGEGEVSWLLISRSMVQIARFMRWAKWDFSCFNIFRNISRYQVTVQYCVRETQTEIKKDPGGWLALRGSWVKLPSDSLKLHRGIVIYARKGSMIAKGFWFWFWETLIGLHRLFSLSYPVILILLLYIIYDCVLVPALQTINVW